VVQNIIMEQVKVPAQLNYLRVLRKFIVRIGTKYGFTSSELYAFKASVDEACANIIEHGYGHTDGSITMKAIVKDESFTIELMDHGRSFDPKQAKKPNLHNYVDIGKKGGLGIFIMRKLLDEIEYQSTSDGNVLRLIKFRKQYSNQGMVVPDLSFFAKIRRFLSM